ncbi:hypothetical protein DITRI_Ditri02bG0151600 [Diplodiscus trichospermus]
MEQKYLYSLPMLLNFLLFIALFVAVRLRIWKKPKSHNRRPKLPPGPPKLPLIGNLHLFMGGLPNRFLTDLAKKHGPRPSSLAASILFYECTGIVFAPYGEHWRQMRKVCALELLSLKRVQSFRAIREEEVAGFIRQISSRAGSPVYLRKRLQSLTYGIISRAAFGVKYEDQDDFTLFVQELKDAMNGFTLVDVFPSLKLVHAISGATSKFKKLHRNFDKILQNIIEQHRAKKATAQSCKEEANDLVNVLLNLQDCGDLGIPLTDSTIKAVIQDIFGGGGDTASITIEWAISEMLKNPRVLRKAQTEVRQSIGGKGDFNEKRLEDLKYLKSVIKETLRLHPPGSMIPRECRESCEINGYEIPAKTKVIVNAWAIGRDPKYWAEPEKFYPERYHDSSIEFKGANFEFIPFGAGRRICPGMAFGIPNIELPLAQLLYHFDWKLPDGTKLEDIDMTELFGAIIARKHDLCFVPIPYHPIVNCLMERLTPSIVELFTSGWLKETFHLQIQIKAKATR